jgi:MoaA/NifB/PqqE/SkfB family radical SAM enzyme
MTRPSLTLLWAVRSHCASHNCRYCYFGDSDGYAAAPPAPGVLSHLSPDDLTAAEVLSFAATLGRSAVGRVFLAGGEPLLWRPVNSLIEVLKGQGLEVVVCTSGVALARPQVSAMLVGLGVDAVSVSLDSADPAHHDAWRPPKQPGDSWDRVIDGVRALLAARSDRSRPRVGLYSVITALNIPDICGVPRLAASLGCDYAVPQPVALPPDHQLFAQLSLTAQHLPALREQFTTLYGEALPVQLPTASYPGQVTAAVAEPTGTVVGCFGGHTLFFAEPDGSVWDCPSTLRIAATPAEARRNIRGADAAVLFPAPRGPAGDCPLFSVDCVNMWPLAGFASMLEPAFTAGGLQ